MSSIIQNYNFFKQSWMTKGQITVINGIVNDKSHSVVHNPIPTAWAKLRGKAIVLRHPEQVLARPVHLMRRFQLEQTRALLRVEENLKGKTTRHWLWRVKDTPDAARRWTQAVGWEAKVLPRRHQALLIINSVVWQSTAAWLQNRCNPQWQTLTNTMNLCYWCLFMYIEVYTGIVNVCLVVLQRAPSSQWRVQDRGNRSWWSHIATHCNLLSMINWQEPTFLKE